MYCIVAKFFRFFSEFQLAFACSAFVAQEGRLLVTADYSQIELVVLAHLSKDENMCRAFRDGVDIHRATAALIYGVEPDVVSPDMRRTAKTINFGVIYGMSAFRLASSLGIPRKQAQDFIDSYFETYSGISQFVSDTVQSAAATGYVQTILGRKRRILNITSGNHPNMLEVISYSVGGDNLYFSAVRGTTVENQIVDINTNECNPLGTNRKMVAVYSF